MSKFLKVLVNSILILAIIVAGGLLIPPFAGVTTVIVDDEGMDTNLSMGSVTYAVALKGNPGEGSKVLLSEGEGQYVYKVQSVDGNNCILEDELSTDGGTIEHTVSTTMKKVILTVPFVGYVSMALRTTEGLIIVGLSVVFVIILFVLAEIWKKDDEDDEDDEDNEDDEDLEEEEDEETEVQLSKREQKKMKKAQAKREKAEAKAAKKAEKKEEKNGKEESSEENVEDTSEKTENLFEETENILAADIAQMMNEQEKNPQEVQETAKEEEMTVQMEEEKEEEAETDGNIRFAIPSYTKDELINKAKEAGDEPEVVEDEISGVTLLDYSDIL